MSANHGGEICRRLLKLKQPRVNVDALEEQLGLGEKAFATALRDLVFTRVVKRDGDYVSIVDERRAAELANAPPDLVEPGKPSKARPQRIELEHAVKIEKGVPLPRLFRGEAYVCPWPFATMVVDDSFAVPVPPGVTPARAASRLRSDVAAWIKHGNPRFRAAIRIEPTGKHVRLWRQHDSGDQKSNNASQQLDAAIARERTSLGTRARRVGDKVAA